MERVGVWEHPGICRPGVVTGIANGFYSVDMESGGVESGVASEEMSLWAVDAARTDADHAAAGASKEVEAEAVGATVCARIRQGESVSQLLASGVPVHVLCELMMVGEIVLAASELGVSTSLAPPPPLTLSLTHGRTCLSQRS